METVALLYEDYQKELAEDFKNTFLKRASDTDSSRSNDTVIDEVTDMLSTNIAVYTEKLLQRWGFSSGGEGGGGGDVTVTLDDLLKKYLSDNYVTIKGDQEVFGEKDFRKGIRIAGRRLYWDEGNDALVIEGAAYTTRWLSAKGVSPGGGGAGSGGAAAMYQLIDVSPNDTKDAVLGAEKDYVLTFDGSFWRGMPNKGGLSSKLFTALDKEGNEVNPDDENAEIYAIRANYSLWSVGFLSAKGISDGGTGGGGGGAVALYQLLDVEKNADITGVAGATKGSVLTFNGDKWYADKPKTAAGISNLFTALDNDGNEVDLNDESKLGTITNIRANYALWSVDWISAKGKSSGGSGGGGGLINLVYGFESLGGTFDNNDNSATFNAFTINEIWKLASSGLTNVTVTGSGNAVTDVIKGSDGRSLTFTKGSTFATKSEFDALNTKFNDFLTGSDADDIINKWSELEVFLQGMKESDNLAVILQSKMDKTAFSKLFTALDASGNEVDPSDDTKTIASIRANFGFWGVDYISAKGVSMSGAQTGTLDSLNDVEITDPVNGQALKYDAASKKWVNGTIDSFNVNQMWAELKKADSSKVIDASHIPTSVLDGRWVKKAGDTMTGTLTSASSSGSIVFKGVENCDITNIYKDNGVIRNDDGGLTSIRNGLRFNWYDTYWYIGNLRGSSTESAGFGVVDHNNKLVLRVTPNDVRAPRFMSTVATGLSPLIVSSNTTVDNLSADLLDGYHAFGTSNALIKYGYTVGGTEPAWCRIATYSIRNTETMTDVCFVLHSSFSDLFGLLVVKTRGTAVVEGLLIASYNINRSNIRIYHDAEKKNIELYCYGGSNYSIIQANLLYSHDRNGGANTNITLYQADTKAPSWSTYVNPVFANLQNSSEAAKKLQTPRTLWGQSFDGTANVSGDMTGVGNITMSGVLTIKNSTYNKQLIIWSAGSTAKNQGEGIWFRCDGATQEVVLRHEWYDTFVPGYGLAVSKHDSLEAGDANMFFYNTGRFIAKAPQGTSPYQCVSTTVNANLNADLLDGLHENSFLRHRDTYGIDGYNTLWAQIGIRQYNNAKPDGMANPIYDYGAVVSLPASGPRLDIWYNHNSSASDYNTNGIQYRSGFNDDKKPWRMLLDSVNYASYSDGRYVKKSGDTMTGDLTMNNTKGFNIGWSTRVVKTSSVWIHGGSDTASSTDANLRFGSWQGIGWYPTIDSTSGVRQGNNAMWLNVRTGVLDVHSNITSHNGYLAANWDSARRLVLGGGSSFARIDSRNSSNSVLCNILLYDNRVVIGNYAESRRFVSTVGTGTQPYQCSSTTLNTNLNADLLDNWHIMDIPRNYNSTATYSLQFALGGTDNNWKKIFACSESGAGPYRSVTVWGRIWYAYGNHAQDEVRSYHFCAIFQMRSGPSASGSNVGYISNSARLYLPTFAKGMDNIRLVRVGTNNFELQVRQIDSWHNGYIQYQYWANGANVSAWRGLQSTSNTSVAVSAGGASTLADSRASSADVWTTARTFYIQDYHSANTGAGVSVNGGSNCYLKLPSTTRFSRIDFSTPNANIRHSGNDNGNEVGNSTLSNLVIDSWYGVSFTTTCSSTYQNKIAMSVNCRTGRVTANNFHAATNITANGAITAKASSSDIRLKTDIQGYDAMGIIRKFRSVKYHWNAIAKENSEVFNHDNWNYGLIAQDLLSGGYSQWVKDAFNDYYTIDYERLIPVVWKGLQEVDDEVTKLKREVARLNKRVKELEKSLCA